MAIETLATDKIAVNTLKDYNIATQDKKDFNMCQFLLERLFVCFDGLVQPCSNEKEDFVIGDSNKHSIRDIWHGDKMQEYRNMHTMGKRLDIFPCNKCSYGVDYVKMWKGRDWTNWNPSEVLPTEKDKEIS